jgi:hypothetical protein
VELLKCFSDPLRIIHPSSLTASIFVQGAWSVSPLLLRYAIWNTEIVIHMTCSCSYHPASSSPTQLGLHFLFLMQLLWHELGACLDQERANYWCQGALASTMHIECVLFSADTQKDKFGTSSFLWASFSAGAISDSCETSLLFRLPPLLSKSRMHKKLCVVTERDIALGDRKGLKVLMLCQPFQLWGCSLDR